MSEPKLEDMGDYNTLKGEKKKVVWSVIFVGIIMSIVYVVVSNVYGTPNDSIKVQETIKTIPLK